jgi:formylglycine-generating enzyme required for sulfatase activity/tRNA A-37 threonylcarbamoyl transferase component Bud32
LAGSSSSPAGAAALSGRKVYDFLAPAQQADELGRLGSYRVLKVLGAGGMGVVFQAEDATLKRKIALKAMLPSLAADESARQRFLREAQTAAAVEHDHIVPIYQVGEDRGVPFIAMPFLKGESLDKRLKREGTLPIAEVARIGREAARGLAAAHAQGLVHRDIKPANLWLEGETGRVKILDFGLAKAASGAVHLTQSGMILGTPAYMAPEQAGGQVPDPRSDLFSLGCVLYEMCTGQRPFQGPDLLAILAAQALRQPPAPREVRPEVPRALSELVLRLLAKKPVDRPPSAQAVIEALDHIDRETAAPLAPRDLIGRSLEERAAAVRDQGSQPSLPRKAKGKKGRKGRKPSGEWWKRPGTWAGVAALVLLVVLWPRQKPDERIGSTAPPASLAKPDLDRRDPPLAPEPLKTEPPPVPVVRPAPVPPVRRDPATGMPVEMTNALGMKLVLIPRGTFVMGSPEDDPLRNHNEAQHEVEISRPFYMGTYPVTVGEFRKFVEATNYRTEPETDGKGGGGYNAQTRDFESGKPEYTWRYVGWEQSDRHPVVNVTWNDAVRFCEWLSREEAKVYALPTEAEWEYACRARTRTRTYHGDAIEGLQQIANIADASLKAKADPVKYADYSFQPWDDGYPFTAPVGRFKPNAWGLYDMLGNVFQWTADWYGGPYSGEFVRDPKGPDHGEKRIKRGTGWTSPITDCRAAMRVTRLPATRSAEGGLRVVYRPEVQGP